MTKWRTRAELESLLGRYQPQEVYDLLCTLVDRHAKNGLFRVMGYDSAKPYHNPTVAVLEPTHPTSTNATIQPFGPAVHPGFEVILQAWQDHPDLLAFIAGEMSQHGRNFTLITNHGKIFDIALVLGGLRITLDSRLSPEIFTQQTSTIVSGGIRTLEVSLDLLGQSVVLPAIDILQMFTRVLTSFPTTPTRKNVKFDPGLVSATNELVRLELDEIRAVGGQMIAMAPSASEDRIFSDATHMQPLMDGTISLMLDSWVLPAAVTLDGSEKPACTVLEPKWITSAEDCHAVMEVIALQCYRQSLVEHIYHRNPSLYQRALGKYGRLYYRS